MIDPTSRECELQAALDIANETIAKLEQQRDAAIAEVDRLRAELTDLQRRYEIRKQEGHAAEMALGHVFFVVTARDSMPADFDARVAATLAAVDRLRLRLLVKRGQLVLWRLRWSYDCRHTKPGPGQSSSDAIAARRAQWLERFKRVGAIIGDARAKLEKL